MSIRIMERILAKAARLRNSLRPRFSRFVLVFDASLRGSLRLRSETPRGHEPFALRLSIREEQQRTAL